jgi:hypothetical protein
MPALVGYRGRTRRSTGLPKSGASLFFWVPSARAALRQPVSSALGANQKGESQMIGTFSSADSALLLIDHQVGTMKLIKNIPLDVVKRNTLALAKTAKILNIPVVLTSSQEQNVQGPLLPELEQILPEAFAARVQRAGIVNAWSDPHFKKAVEATGRRNLIMAM